jgi:hypothetical protein
LVIKLNNNSWITPGVSISCRHKRELYLLYRNSNDVAFKNYYRQILKSVIREAEEKYFSRQVLKSSNKIRTIWNITKLVTGKLTKVDKIQELKVKGEVISYRQDIADSLNTLLLSVAENNISKNFKPNTEPSDYLRQALIIPSLV